VRTERTKNAQIKSHSADIAWALLSAWVVLAGFRGQIERQIRRASEDVGRHVRQGGCGIAPTLEGSQPGHGL